MGRVSLKDLCILLGIQSVVYVVRCGRLIWFGHLKHKGLKVWIIGCQPVEMWWWHG